MSATLTIRKKRKTFELISFTLYIIPFIPFVFYVFELLFANNSNERLFIYISAFIITLLPCSILSFICLKISRIGIYKKTKKEELKRIITNAICVLAICVGLMGWSLLYNALN